MRTPTSAPFSTMRIDSTPRARSWAEVSSALKPPPMINTSTSSLSGARSASTWSDSAAHGAEP